MLSRDIAQVGMKYGRGRSGLLVVHGAVQEHRHSVYDAGYSLKNFKVLLAQYGPYPATLTAGHCPSIQSGLPFTWITGDVSAHSGI